MDQQEWQRSAFCHPAPRSLSTDTQAGRRLGSLDASPAPARQSRALTLLSSGIHVCLRALAY